MFAEIRDVETSEVLSVPAEGKTFGRMGMGKADLEVPHNAVSSLHARIFSEDGNWYLEDLGSSNGTYVGTERLEGRVRLEVGLRFSLSRYKYEVVRLGDLGDEDPTGAWDGYPEASEPPSEMALLDDEGTGMDPRLIETERGQAHRPESEPAREEALEFLKSPLGMGLAGGGVLLCIVVVLVVALLPSAEEGVPKTVEVREITPQPLGNEGSAEVATALEAAEAAPVSPVSPAEEEIAQEDEAPADAASSEPDALAQYHQKVSAIDKALKKNKRLMKKKGVAPLYKQLKKKSKQIRKKLRNKPAQRDAALLKQTGPLVDKLHHKLF